LKPLTFAKINNPRFKPWAINKNIPYNRFNGLLVLCAISTEDNFFYNPRFKPWATNKNVLHKRFNGLHIICAISPETVSILSLKKLLEEN
jgi:hypothetical protein